MTQHRFSEYLTSRAQWEREAGITKCEPLRLTPGQHAELCAEQGYPVTVFTTCQGQHPVEVINHHIRATGDNVILCPREDLFQETDRGTGIELVSAANSVTSVPDNIACVEVISVGPLVDCGVKPGDIAFLDFFRVKQGYIVANEECYIAPGDAFAALYDKAAQDILPLDNYVVTRTAKDRFAVALTGSHVVRPPDITLTDGFTSGKTSKGGVAARTTYQEIVALGRLTNRPRPGVMTVVERKVLDLFAGPGCVARARSTGDTDRHTEHDSIDAQEAELLNQLVAERVNGRKPDLKVGDLVGVCTEIATKVRVRGEYRWIAPYDNTLGVVDDKAIEQESVKRSRGARSTVLVGV